MHDELRLFGLTDNEIKIYIALLRLGEASPTEISKRTGMHRAYIYDALERLMEKGMISYVFVNNRRRFVPADPRNLIELAEAKAAAIEKVVPELQRIMTSEKTDTKVEIHKGKGVLKRTLHDVLISCGRGDVLYAIGIDDSLYRSIDPIHLSRYLVQAKKKGMKECIISPKGSPPHPEAEITEYRYLDRKYMTMTATWIYADKVIILTLGTPFTAIFIQNKDISDTYKKQFELLWKTAEK